MATVSDLIHSSFRLIGAVAAGEVLETNELNDALISLNQMIASWNTEGLSIAGRQRLMVNVNQSLNNYPMPQRAVRIESASVAIAGIDCPLQIVDSAGWETITEKAQLATFILKLYCDYQYPSATVYIWPTPRQPGVLEMWVYVPIAAFVNLTDNIDLPPGYEAALRYNFAIAVLPEYPRSQVDQTLPAQAQNYKASLVQLNSTNHARTAQPNLAVASAQGTS